MDVKNILKRMLECWTSIVTLKFGTKITAESFGFTHENSVRISFPPTETEGRPIGTVLYRIVSNAVPLLRLLSTHTFHNCIMWQANPELSLRQLIPFCFSCMSTTRDEIDSHWNVWVKACLNRVFW